MKAKTRSLPAFMKLLTLFFYKQIKTRHGQGYPDRKIIKTAKFGWTRQLNMSNQKVKQLCNY